MIQNNSPILSATPINRASLTRKKITFAINSREVIHFNITQCNFIYLLDLTLSRYLSLPPPSSSPPSLPLLSTSPSLLNLEMPPNIKDQRSIHKQLLTLTTGKRFLTHMHTLQITKMCSRTSQDAFKTTQLF